MELCKYVNCYSSLHEVHSLLYRLNIAHQSIGVIRLVFEVEASGWGRVVSRWSPPPFPFPPLPYLPLSIPPKFSDKPVGGKVRSSEGEVPRLPSYKYRPGRDIPMVVYRLHLRTGDGQTAGLSCPGAQSGKLSLLERRNTVAQVSVGAAVWIWIKSRRLSQR